MKRITAILLAIGAGCFGPPIPDFPDMPESKSKDTSAKDVGGKNSGGPDFSGTNFGGTNSGGSNPDRYEGTGRDPKTPSLAGSRKKLTLSAGVYRGDLRVSGNDNDILGAGANVTIIDGDLIVEGSRHRVAGLTIRGRTVLEGSRHDITGVDRDGEIQVTGTDHRY